MVLEVRVSNMKKPYIEIGIFYTTQNFKENIVNTILNSFSIKNAKKVRNDFVIELDDDIYISTHRIDKNIRGLRFEHIYIEKYKFDNYPQYIRDLIFSYFSRNVIYIDYYNSFIEYPMDIINKIKKDVLKK